MRPMYNSFAVVIAAKTAIQQREISQLRRAAQDSRFRGNDKFLEHAKVPR
jgi:hypothetical protein